MGIYEDNYIVRISQVNKNNQLSIASLLDYLQEIASKHSDLVGFGIKDRKYNNLAWFILNWKVKIFSLPCWNDKIKIKTWPRKSDKLYSYRDFEILDVNNNIIAIASSKWILMDISNRSIQKITSAVDDAYGNVNICVFNNDNIDKLKEPEFFNTETNYTVQRRDIDVNGHVNNLYYLYFAYEALPDEIYNNCNFSEIEIMYKKECKYGDKLKFLYSKINENEHIVTIKSDNLETLHCIIKLKK